jgi:hypothetical protein
MNRRSCASRVLPLSLFLSAATVTTGCTVIDVQRGAPLNFKARWALMPILDYTETAQAGVRVEDPLATLVRTKLDVELAHYPVAKEQESLAELDERQRYQQALSWAQKEGYAYGLTGSVNEWRYRNGADGEAAVGLTINVVEIESGRTLWSATGSRAGWGRETASGTAQRLLRDMLDQMFKKR